MIPNDPNLNVDPFDALCVALGTALKSLIPNLKNAVLGWPDPKWLEDTGVNFPSVFFVNISEKSTNTTSRNKVHAAVVNQDGTQNVYYETQRLQSMLQISLFTTDPQHRLDYGWQIKQFLINTIQLSINPVNTAKFTYTGHDHMPDGRDNLYQRDLGFEVSYRVLDGEVAHTNEIIQENTIVT